jgi:enamine deaminase RidA (YjgF/YER057c/UK114 family)
MDGHSTDRRSFLAVTLAGTGALAVMMPEQLSATASSRLQTTPEQRLKELGITLPAPQQPSATLVPAVLSGSMLYCSGHGPRAEGKNITGKLGADLTPEQGKEAARLAGLNILSTVRNSLGTLDRVVRLVKTFGMVNSAPDFTGQSGVINGFSELMIQIFGEEAGKGARSAVGMSSLPVGWAVEIEAIFEVRPA